MSHVERQSAIIQLFRSDTDILPSHRTYVCLGVARGGTSAVAGSLQRLGIFMGNDLPNNYEDPCFGPSVPSSKMRNTIAERNETHEVWGWKFPAAANYLEGLHKSLRNPCLVIVFRDVAATIKGHMRWHNRDIQVAAHDVLMQQQKNWFLLERWRVPTILISYEKAIIEPQIFATELARLVGVPEPDEPKLAEIAEFLTPRSYK